MSLDLITASKAAQLLEISEREVLQLVAEGTLTLYRRGREVLVDRTEVEKSGR